MSCILLFCCLVLIHSIQVSGDCGSIIGDIPEAKPVSETHIGIVWNVTADSQTNWTFAATKINSKPIPTELKGNIESYFSVQPSLSPSNTTVLALRIIRPLDKEEYFWVNASGGVLDRLDFKLECTSPFGPSVPKDIFIIITPVNEYPHTFKSSVPKQIEVQENLETGKSVFHIFPYIIDKDIPKPSLTDFTYTIEANSIIQNDGSQWFSIPIASSDSVEVKKSPDFDQLYKQNMNILSLTIVVKANDDSGFQINTTLQIKILDVDDQPPYFRYSGCNDNCSVTPYESYTGVSWRGTLTVLPNTVTAQDQDSLKAPIIYSLLASPNNYHTSFEIDQKTAVITQIKDVTKMDILTIMATENTTNRHFKTATLLVRLTNDSAYIPGASKIKDDNTNFELIAIIVGAISVVIIGILIFLIIFVYKRAKRQMSVLPESTPISPKTSVEDLMSDKPETIDEKVNNWQHTIDPEQWPTVRGKRQQLDPLSLKDESTETEESSIKKKKPRKKKKRLMEIFDGTNKFEDKADPEFYMNPDKKKIKRSTKSKNMRTEVGPLVVKSD